MSKKEEPKWKTEDHTCNKCCNASVKAGKRFCDRCENRIAKKGANRLLNKFGFHINDR